MSKYYQTAFWVITFVFLTLSFGRSYGGYAQSFYFVTCLFPVILGTSVFFNSFLVPRYLLRKRYLKFILYTLYALVFSVYLEILVLTLSLVVFANYQFDRMNPRTRDILFLTVLMYALVFANTIFVLLQEYLKGQDRNKALEKEWNKLKRGYLVVTSERKSIQMEFESILYIESVGNYVRIYRNSGKPVMTKEKTSAIQERLPDSFVRIHRSIVVNSDHITSFNRECVNVKEVELPIGRKHKEEALRRLGIH